MGAPAGDEKKRIIAARAREARKLAGLSQAQVAKLMGLHRPSISEAEAGRRSFTGEELARLADIYDVKVSWLAGEDAERLDVHDDRVQLAARELTKLKPDDLDRLLTILAAMREQGGG
jgi:transcriptional regulator with XRE-family HTH domain